jgi:hypothetical protein
MEVSPPACNGTINCEAAAECQASCKGEAKADIDCPAPQVVVKVVGDAKLQAAIEAHAKTWGEAVNLTLALKGPIAELAGKTTDTFSALGEVGLAGAACLVTSLKASAEASVSISVSVSASASVSSS